MHSPGSVVAVIPARAGSKGIPGKNLRTVGGRSLVGRAVDAARAAATVDVVVVSTDGDAIAAEALAAGARVVRRPDDLSGDEASSESALLHALDTLTADADADAADADAHADAADAHADADAAATAAAADASADARAAADAHAHAHAHAHAPTDADTPAGAPTPAPADIVVFLQATSPFVDPADLDRAVGRVRDGSADVVFSAAPSHVFLWRTAPDGSAVAVNHDAATRPRRQDREPEFRETGAFYVFRAEGLRQHRHRFHGRVEIAVVDPALAIDVDDVADLEHADALASTPSRADGTRT